MPAKSAFRLCSSRLLLCAGGCLALLIAWLLLGPAGQPVQAAEPALDAPTGIQTTSKVLVAVTLTNADSAKLKGTLRAELVADGKVVEQLERPVNQADRAEAYRFEFAAPKQPLNKLSVRYSFGKTRKTVALKKILLAKAHETVLSAGQEFHAGSPASLRCAVHGVKSLTETVPLPGATIAVRLHARDGKVFKLYDGKAGADGVANVRFTVPALAAGAYKMVVATKSGLGEEKLEREVKIKEDAKVLLVTDKPLYQPGQIIHIRALSLNSFNLKPVARATLVFEVEDSKGNKVFKREQTTSAYGIAAIDFQLASEVNTGDYRVRALLGKTQADKTVSVKPYVLPKFKADLSADKKFYLPKETVHADLQADYFFGKPVAGAKVKVSASTFDVAFKEFQTWEGKTDERGHVRFEIKLPDYFVGLPLAKGNALVKIEAKVTDTADHTEKFTRTYAVSDQPIKVSLIPETGRLVPGLENRVFAAAIYPDGSPARADVKVWLGNSDKGKLLATLKTSAAGLTEFTFTPKKEQFRAGQWGMHNVEMVGGTNKIWAPTNLLDLHAEVKDARGSSAKATSTLSSEPLGENVLLRLDKAIYKGGDSLNVDIRTSAGLPTVYLDVVRSGQTMLTEWLDVKDGKAQRKLALPPETFGTLEVHAYQMLASGEIIRDSRVVYVQPASDLKIKVHADKKEYLPGQEGIIRFEVTDSAGKPMPAALGILIVDEAVYALQEMQPGLEKVYFTLQEELLKPQAQAVYKPNETIDTLVLQPQLPAARQQVARVLLTAVRPKLPARWDVNPAVERSRNFEKNRQRLGWGLWQHACNGKAVVEYNKEAKSWRFKKGLLKELADANLMDRSVLNDSLGGLLGLEGLSAGQKDFTADRLARAITSYRINQQLVWTIIHYAQQNRARFLGKDGKWTYPADAVEAAARLQGLALYWTKDGWGNSIRLLKRDKKVANNFGHDQLSFHELVSAGPDGKFGTADDVIVGTQVYWPYANGWGDGQPRFGRGGGPRGFGGRGDQWMLQRRMKDDARMPMPGLAPALPKAAAGGRGQGGAPFPEADTKNQKAPQGGPANAAAPPMRLREYFPETMLWQPALITDDKGIARLPLTFADSITTWRLTASASSTAGQLGGVSAPLRVFQDFFVDLDLPVALTQNDEVAFPVAVYNYLKTPQTVTLDLQPEPWFELVEGKMSRALDLKPGEVTAIKFRIRARKIGFFPLTVKARGSKMSDAIKRLIEVAPDGQKVEQVVSDRLSGKVTQVIDIPANAIPDASKLIVKVYPGVFSQILEGVEGLIRLPGG